MERQLSVYHSFFQKGLRLVAKVSHEVRRAWPLVVLCLAVLALGAVSLAPDALTHAWARITGSNPLGSSRWWAAQSVHAQGTSGSGTFTVFDVSGVGVHATMGTSINDGGDIAGVFLTAPTTSVPNLAHGFVRSAATGMITEFDASGAGMGKNQGTFPASINATGDIAGMYFDSNNAYHGFVRSAATTTITPFDVPAAPTNIGHRGTLPISMNAGGDIAGFYVDANDVRHGFVRSASGNFSTFDAPGAGTAGTQGTVPFSINTAGDITGFYKAANGTFHGFLRAGATGTITAPIDAPGAGTGPGGKLTFMGTIPLSFDAAGDVAGVYADSNSVNHGFVFTAGSATPSFTTFDDPAAVASGLFPGTIPSGMNAGGDISGIYTDASGVHHGFLRKVVSGTPGFTTFDAPNASTTGMLSGTIIVAINSTDEMTGTFLDTNGVFHAFLLVAGSASPPPAATPTFSPAAGTYTSPQMVTISDTTAGATIFYTTNGNTPTTADTKFTTPIQVNSTETIKAIATATGFSNSEVGTATYTITTPTAAMPTFSPPAGNYTSAQMVTISDTTPGATIFYTTNGNTPTTADTKFTTPIQVNSTETIMAIAAAPGFSDSAVATAAYTFNPDFQVLVNPTALTIVAGKTGTATFTVTPVNGFNSAVTFTCSGLPSEATCGFNPTSVTPSGAAATSTLTVMTMAPSAGMPLSLPAFLRGRPIYALLFSALAIIFAIAARRRRPLRALQLLGTLILLMVASGLTSCGGSGGNPGTPVGTSSVSVSASAGGAGGPSHTATLTITITH